MSEKCPQCGHEWDPFDRQALEWAEPPKWVSDNRFWAARLARASLAQNLRDMENQYPHRGRESGCVMTEKWMRLREANSRAAYQRLQRCGAHTSRDSNPQREPAYTARQLR